MCFMWDGTASLLFTTLFSNTSRHLINICLLLLFNSYVSHSVPILKACEGVIAYNRRRDYHLCLYCCVLELVNIS